MSCPKLFTSRLPQGLLTATLAGALLVGILAVSPGVVFAYANSVTYRGQGLVADGFGGYDLTTELCGVVNGANAEGPYLLWVLTAASADNAEITGPWGTAPMTQSGGGTYKYVSGWYDPDTLPGSITATYDGARRNAQLVISHGCRPFTRGAWCSPGFWKNAETGAWTLINVSKTDLFNTTVVPNFYDTAYTSVSLPNGPILSQALDPAGPGGANKFGAADDPYGLNAYNATGAFLSDHIPGYIFDPTLVDGNESDTCPIDHHGNFK